MVEHQYLLTRAIFWKYPFLQIQCQFFAMRFKGLIIIHAKTVSSIIKNHVWNSLPLHICAQCAIIFKKCEGFKD